MKFKELLKNMSYTLTSNFITLAVSTILVLVVPKFIGVEEYGYWQLYIFYATYVGVLTFGWADGIYLRYGGIDYNELDKKLFHSQLLMAFLLQLLIFCVIFFYTILISDVNKIFIFRALAVCLVLFNMRGFILYILQDTNRIREYAFVNSAGRIIYFILVIAALLIDRKDYKLLIVADLIGRLISLLVGMFYIKDIIFEKTNTFFWSFREAWTNISVGIKLMIANFAGMLIIGVVRYGIQWKWGVSIFGKVSLTLSISNFVMTFVSAVSLVLYPTLRRLGKDKTKSLYPDIRNIVIILLCLALIAYYPIAYVLPKWLPKYSDSLTYLAIIFPMFVYQGKFDLLINTFMKTFRFERGLLKVNMLTVIFSVLCTLLNVFVIKLVPSTMFSIVLILWFQSTLGELYLTNKLQIKIGKDIFLETIIILVFMISSWYLNLVQGFCLFIVLMLLVMLFCRKDIQRGLKLFI